MSIEVDVLGYRYDNADPAFMELEGGFYYHLPTRRRLDRVEFDAKLVAEGKSFAAGELGYPSFWRFVNGEDMLAAFAPPAGSAPMSVSITKIPSGIDDTGEITVTGGPTDEPLMITITTRDSTSTLVVYTYVVVEVEAQDDADTVAANIAAANYDPNFISVAAVGAVVTFTPSTGGSIAVFTQDTYRPL